MFEGLDQVDWRVLRHAYGSAVDIPSLLQAFADATDEDSLEETFSGLINKINHQGSIYSATAATVPFLVQLLNNKDFPNRSWILYAFISLLWSCDSHTQHNTEISTLRDDFETWTSIGREVSTYLSLLQDNEEEIRSLASELLAMLHHRLPLIRLRLWRASEVEKNLYVRAIMIDGVGRLIDKGYWDSARRVGEQYRIQFEALASSIDDPIIRLSAASAWVESHPRPPWNIGAIPKIIPHTLSDVLGERLPSPRPSDYFLRFALEEHIILRLQRLGIEGMAEALHANDLSKHAAHLILREMLEMSFVRIGPLYPRYISSYMDTWDDYGPSGRLEEHDSYIYQYKTNRVVSSRYSPGEELNPRQRSVIEAAVNCDQFWQMPTNLFSFFYGLPDSRDELRVLLRASDVE